MTLIKFNVSDEQLEALTWVSEVLMVNKTSAINGSVMLHAFLLEQILNGTRVLLEHADGGIEVLTVTLPQKDDA